MLFFTSYSRLLVESMYSAEGDLFVGQWYSSEIWEPFLLRGERQIGTCTQIGYAQTGWLHLNRMDVFFWGAARKLWNLLLMDDFHETFLFKMNISSLSRRGVGGGKNVDTNQKKTLIYPKGLLSGRVGWSSLVFLVCLCVFPQQTWSASLAGSKVEHPGVCPNKLNANLWVDAQSTCERECEVDEVRHLYVFNI